MAAVINAEGEIAALFAPYLAHDRNRRLRAALLIGATAALIAALIAWFFGLVPAMIWGVAIAAFALVVLAAWVWLRRDAPTALHLARDFDRALGRAATLATGLEHEARAGAQTLFTRRVHAEALALAPRFPLIFKSVVSPALHVQRRAAVALAIVAPVALLILISPRAQAVAPPPLANAAALAARVADEAARRGDAGLQSLAQQMDDLVRQIAAGTAGPEASQQVQALGAAINRALGGTADGDPGIAVSRTLAQQRLADWAGQEMTFSANAPPPATRAAPRVTTDLAARGGATAGEGERSRPNRLDASLEVDALDLTTADQAQDSRSASAPGQSTFIPPQLREGAPQPGLAIDMAGAGDAPRQESMQATGGGGGAAPPGAPPPPPPAATGQSLAIIYSGITPRDTPVHYLTAADRAAGDYADVTVGGLPAYARQTLPPAQRQGFDAADARAAARFFARGQEAMGPETLGPEKLGATE
ncbi:hypothetical protein [Ketogulonicigenium vulgare]|uniref:Uncharacterized protein n=1 Tax=Ketogulonicigenium vulgare (strain WSH-001) TaxID=759362 RepID=F9Y738_KETVW|nr:hypothetical protein [Ketogulonicigenium vulgare]AEM42228.1 hypothetical protein KVU_2389 [Ketogulonicigenium vulgare WSH-001]ALJ82192.1 hypothetical protein KVH_00765 [Ketogulonicigenium vulgare]ANW34822.1 hypothetical protein KvSKV_00775 [Ketogulonicigenium vulgare]